MNAPARNASRSSKRLTIRGARMSRRGNAPTGRQEQADVRGGMARKLALLERIVADPALSSSAKVAATGLLLRFHNTTTGRCDPSFGALADAIGRTRRATITAVQDLAATGWITSAGTSGGARNTNRITFNDGYAPSGQVKAASPQRRRREVKSASPQNMPGVKCTAFRGEVGCTRTSENLSGLRPEEDEDARASARLAPRSHFQEFWQAYPRREAKDKAEAEFDAVLASGRATAEELIAGAFRYADRRAAATGADAAVKFTKLPANWLQEGRWSDDVAASDVAPTTAKHGTAVSAMLRAGGWEAGR